MEDCDALMKTDLLAEYAVQYRYLNSLFWRPDLEIYSFNIHESKDHFNATW